MKKKEDTVAGCCYCFFLLSSCFIRKRKPERKLFILLCLERLAYRVNDNDILMSIAHSAVGGLYF